MIKKKSLKKNTFRLINMIKKEKEERFQVCLPRRNPCIGHYFHAILTPILILYDPLL